MDIIKIDDEMINEYYKKSINQLKDIFSEINIMRNNLNNLVWEGKSCIEFKKIYSTKMDEYFKYAGKMVLFLDFTNKLTNNYNNATEEIITEFKKTENGEVYGENSR